MPTIFEKDGYRVVIYTRNEHGPPHVHVLHGDTEIAISIAGGEVRRAEAIVAERIGDCLAAWNRYHGGAS